MDSDAVMTFIADKLKEFGDKYSESKYNPAVFTDEELIAYTEVIGMFMDSLGTVLQKLKNEQYQRKIDHAHQDQS